MNEKEWNESNDAGAMLDYVWQIHGAALESLVHSHDYFFPRDALEDPVACLNHRIHRFYVASARRIWKLLPQIESRRGVELIEAWFQGKVTYWEVSDYNWEVEGASFKLDEGEPPKDPDVNRWVAEVQLMAESELRSILNPPDLAGKIDPWELLTRAAYFADRSMMYPTCQPMGPPREGERLFLSAAILRQHLDYPGKVLPEESHRSSSRS